MKDFIKEIITAKTHRELTITGYNLAHAEVSPMLKIILMKVYKYRRRKLGACRRRKDKVEKSIGGTYDEQD